MEYKLKMNRVMMDVQVTGCKKVEKEETYEEGFKAGFEEGRRVGRSEIRIVKQRLESVVEAFLKERENFLKSMEPTILKLIKVIAQKVIQREINTNPEIILGVVKEALQRVVDSEKVLLKINPQDLEEVKKMMENWVSLLGPVSEFKIIGDDGISRGGCLVETSYGTIDGTIESKIEKIEDLLS